jgi:hypothetical protein
MQDLIERQDFCEEVVQDYINLLKTLALTLQKHPRFLPLFSSKSLKEYTLFNLVQKFSSHSDALVRTSVKTITLTLL